MTRTQTLIQAQKFGISFVEARYLRVKYIVNRITEIEPLCLGIKFLLDMAEESKKKIREISDPYDPARITCQESILEAEAAKKRHWVTMQELGVLERELKEWRRPLPVYVLTKIDWGKIRQYPCTDLLGKPAKMAKNEWVYHAPHRIDRKPSFWVNRDKNVWHDWATDQGGDVIDLYILLYGGTVGEAGRAISKLV